MLPFFINVHITFRSYHGNKRLLTCSKVFAMKDPIIKRTFIAGCAALLLSFIIPLFLFATPGTGAVHQQFFSNSFFVNIGFMGDAVFAFAVVFFLLFLLNKKDMSLRLLLTLSFLLFFIQFAKNIINPQPAHLYFEAGDNAISFYRNLISSHTAIACMLAGFFAMHTKKTFLRISFLIAAFAVAYSRIYFGETFFAAGTGIAAAGISLLLAQRIRFESRIRSGYTGRKGKRISPQQLLPA